MPRITRLPEEEGREPLGGLFADLVGATSFVAEYECVCGRSMTLHMDYTPNRLIKCRACLVKDFKY